jgi:uncharacterized membrane protein
MKKMHISVMGLLLFFVTSSFAYEHIKSYDSHIVINKDGSLDITETIVAHAEGINIKRGIYRDFPIYYKGKDSFISVIVPFDVQGVWVDGKEIAPRLENISRGKRVYLGNAQLSVPADHTFVLKYRTARQIGFFKDHDELFFNGVGQDWRFSISKAVVTIVLPSGINAHECKLLASVGALDSQERSYTVKVINNNTIQFEASRILNPYEGLTFTVEFKKGIVIPPTAAQRQASFFRDNSQLIVCLLFLLLLLLFLVFSYIKIQNNRPPQNIFPLFEAPKGFTPGMVNYFVEREVTADVLSSDIVAMAVAGFIGIETKEEGLIFKSTVYTLTRTDKKIDNEYHAEQLGTLFKEGSSSVIIKQSYNKSVEKLFIKTKDLCDKKVGTLFNNHIFSSIQASTRTFAVILVIMYLTQFLLSGFLGLPFIESIGTISSIICVILFLIATFMFRGYTKDGYQIKDEIDGFKLYLETAERERLKFVSTPPTMTPQHYETMLPYAMALGVEEAWSKQFTPIFKNLEQAGTPYHPYWYHGRPFRSSVFGRSFANNMRPALSSSIGASAPGSSSGFSSGSSSGGGGGGGGGGGF